jgi:hypothetical protein
MNRLLGFLLRLLLAAQFAASPTPALAQVAPEKRATVPGDILLGAVLKKFASDIEDIIDKAKNAADFIVVDAAGQVSLIIQQAQAEFQNDLDLAQARWSATEANAIASISSTITVIEKRAFKDAKELADIVQLTANTVPFSNKYPQVRSITPNAVAAYEDPVFVQVLGNFVDSSRKGYQPNITINDQVVMSSTVLTTALGFMVPQRFLPHGAGLSYPQVKVIVPYRHCSFLWFACHKIANFSTVITSLPPSPGSITFYTDYETAGYTRKQTTSPILPLDSHDGDHQRVCLKVGPEPGWSNIDPYTVALRDFWGGGDYHVDGSCSTDLVAGWAVSVIQHHWPNCCDGAVHFRLDFVEYKPSTEHHPTQEELTIKWGEAIMRTFDPRGTWRAVYHQFGGKDVPFGPGAPNDNKYVSWTQAGNQVTFSTATYDQEHSHFERRLAPGSVNPETVANPQERIVRQRP